MPHLTSSPVNVAPRGAVVEELRAVDGVRLRAARWAPEGETRGTVALFGGRGEFIEKHYETIGDLLQRNFAVAALDWRGQGGSERQLRNRMKAHIDDFSLYERDFAAFVTDVLAPYCPRPWFGLGNSMGAAILLMIAYAGRCPFERVALTSPMIGIAGVTGRPRVQLLIEALDAIGLGGAFAPGGKARPSGLGPFENNVWTSDPVRYARWANAVRADASIGVGWPTISWLLAAIRLTRQFEDFDYPRSILTPMLVFAAGKDRVAVTGACERFAERLRAGRLIVIDGAEHEILLERDVFRDQFWSAFDAFIPGAEGGKTA